MSLIFVPSRRGSATVVGIVLCVLSCLLARDSGAEQIPRRQLDKMRQALATRIKRALVQLASAPAAPQRLAAARSLAQERAPLDGISYHFSQAEVSTLVAAIEKEQDLSVQLAALAQLSNVSHFSSGPLIGTLLDKLSRGTPGEQRSEARYQRFWLRTRRDPRTYDVFGKLDYPNHKRALRNLVIHAHRVVSRWTLSREVLARDAKALVPQLVRLLRGKGPAKLLREACEVLQTIGPAAAAALTQLVESTQHPAPAVQVAALLAAKAIQPARENRALYRALQRCLSHRYWRVRKLAVELLVQMKMRPPRSVAVHKDPVVFVRESLKTPSGAQ